MEFFSELKIFDLLREYLIKSSLVLTFSLGLIFLFRKKSAALRHFMLSFSLISLLLFPLLSSLSTGWETKLLPARSSEHIYSSAKLGESDKNNILAFKNFEEANTSDKKTLFFGNTEKGKKIPASLWTQIGPLKNTLETCLFILWFTGLFFLFTRIFLGLYGARRLTRQGKNLLSFPWQHLLQKLRKSLSLTRKISLLRHARVLSPLTWGVIRPVIIMPDDSSKWTLDQRNSALFHELSHIKRGDFLIKTAARISCAVFWFNPLSWITYKMMKLEQEKACDEFVIKAGVRPSTYATNLLSIKRLGQAPWNPPSAVLGVMGENQLNKRLLTILKKQFNPKEIKMKTKIMLSLTFILLIVVIGMARPAPSITSSETTIGQKDSSPPVFLQTVQEQQKKEQTKESFETQEKESKEKKKKINIYISKDGKYITISRKDGTKNTFTLKGDDKDYIIIKDKKGNWNISADKLEYHQGDVLKGIKFKKEDGYLITSLKGDKNKVIELKDHGINLYVTKKGQNEHSFGIFTDKDKEGNKIIYVTPDVEFHSDIELDQTHDKLKKKIKEIQEKLQKITEAKISETLAEIDTQTLKEVEEILAQVSEELAQKSEILKDMKFSIHTKSEGKVHDHEEDIHDHKKNYFVLQHKDLNKITEGDSHFFVHKGDHLSGSVKYNDTTFELVFNKALDKELIEKHKEIIENLKKELPAGYKIEAKIDEEAEIFKIIITGDNTTKKEKFKIQHVIDKIIDQIKKVKESKAKK